MDFQFGSWESQSVPIFWHKSAMGKFCPNQKLFIPLEISQRENIEIEFEFSIWNFELGIMAKRKVRSQIGNNYDQFNTQPLKPKK
jgi:hypothetical protein